MPTPPKPPPLLPCPGLLDIGCQVTNWFASLARSFVEAATWMLTRAVKWWTEADRSSMLKSPAINTMHSLLMYVGISVLVGSVMWQGTQLMMKRKPEPLVNTGLGLLSFLGWSTMGTTLAVTINEAGIALSSMVLDESIKKFADGMSGALIGMSLAAPALVLLFSLVLWVLALIQWILGFFRIGAVILLLALLPTAAAGQLNESTKPWLRKVLSWCLSLLLYQPLSAIVFSMGFLLMGEGQGLSEILVGMATMALGVLCMPTMLRFFDWGGQKLVPSSAGSGGGAMAVGAAANMMSGAGFAGFMNRNGPGSNSPEGADTSGGTTEVGPANQGPGSQSAGGAEAPGGAGSSGQGRTPSSGTSESTTTGDAGDDDSQGPPTRPMPVPSGAGGGAPDGAADAAGAGSGGVAGSATGGAAANGAAGAAGPVGAAVAAGQVAREQAQRAKGAVTDATKPPDES